MKILQINCVYQSGSTGKIVCDIHSELLNRDIQSVVCYGRGKKVNIPNVYKIFCESYFMFNSLRCKITGLIYGGAYCSTRLLEHFILKEKPDIVHLQCINGYFVNIYKLVDFLKVNHIKTLITLHAEFMYTANCGYAFDCNRWMIGCGNCPQFKELDPWFFDRTATSWKKMKKAFEGFNDGLIIVSVSPWLMNRAKCSPMLSGKKHTVVLNGLNTDIFHFYKNSNLKESLRLNENKILVFHVSPNFTNEINNIKGGYYLIELAKQMPDFQFVVAGPYANDIKVPDNVKLLGRIKDQSLLAQYYSTADICVLTSKKETFSMVCAESLCCGTPIVGFKAGAPEMIALKKYSEFVDFGDVRALKHAIIRMTEEKISKVTISAEAIKVYSKERMTAEYIQLYRELLNYGN